MIQYEKEQDNYGELGDNINNIHDLVKKHDDLLTSNGYWLGLSKLFSVFAGFVSLSLLLVIIAVITQFHLGFGDQSPEFAKHVSYLKHLFIGVSQFFFISLFHRPILKIIPGIKNIFKKRKKDILDIEEKFSQKDQFNYLLFIDVLIDKCPSGILEYDKDRIELIELRQDFISLSTTSNKEKLLEFMYYKIDFLVELSQKLLSTQLEAPKETEEVKQFESIYQQFVKKSGVMLQQKQKSLQKFKNRL